MATGSNAAASTVAALRERFQEYDIDRGATRLSNAVVRGAAIGVAGRGGFYLLSALARRLLRSKPPAGRRTPTVDIFKNVGRYAAMIGSFGGIYVAADELIAILVGEERSAGWRSLVAGAVAGPTLSLLENGEAMTGIAVYAFLKGAVLLVRCGNLEGQPGWMRVLLAPTRWKDGDVFFLCCNSAMIFHSWIMNPDLLPKAYVRFLSLHGGKRTIHYRAMAELIGRHEEVARSGAGVALRTFDGTPLAGRPMRKAAQFAHPGQGTLWHAVQFVPGGIRRALPIYVPVYVVPAVLLYRSRLLRPRTLAALLPKLGVSIFRSSLFLALYCAGAWLFVDGFQDLQGHATGPGLAAGGFLSGLSLLVEKKSRRMELAVYTGSRAFEAAALKIYRTGLVPPALVPRRPDVVLFSAACAFVLHCYSDHRGARRDAFRKQYLSLFDWMLGNSGFGRGRVHHSPSNADYLRRVGSSASQLLARASSRALSRSIDDEIDASFGKPEPPRRPTSAAGDDLGAAPTKQELEQERGLRHRQNRKEKEEDADGWPEERRGAHAIFRAPRIVEGVDDKRGNGNEAEADAAGGVFVAPTAEGHAERPDGNERSALGAR